MIAPNTSTTLLRDLAADTQHVRWTEFYVRYRPLMQEYMGNRFPNLNADEAVQDTLIALTKVLPDYRYVPGEKGPFHHYLIGILKRKALLIGLPLGEDMEKELSGMCIKDKENQCPL